VKDVQYDYIDLSVVIGISSSFPRWWLLTNLTILDRVVGLGSQNERALERRHLIYGRGGSRLLVLIVSSCSCEERGDDADLWEFLVLSGI